MVTSYLAARSEQNVLERIQSLNEKVYEQLRQSLSNDAAQSELERFMTSGISKSVSNETLAEITTVANKYTNSFFLNVVEEPAQTDNNEIFLFPILFWYRLSSIIQFKKSKTTLVNGLYNLYAEKINE